MTSLFKHQTIGIEFLQRRGGAMLADEMGLGKSRQALSAATQLFIEKKIDRVLILCPAAVRYSWHEELGKVDKKHELFDIQVYRAKDQSFVVSNSWTYPVGGLKICTVSYGLLTRDNHVKELERWLRQGEPAMICDESSFISNRTTKTTKAAYKLAHSCQYRWLLNGTPITQSPMDMWAQGMIMMDGKRGALAGFNNFFHFRGTYGIMGGFKMKQIVEWCKLDDLQRRFKPYILRRLKRDCLDLPPKTYVTRDVTLDPDTWEIYEKLRKEALLSLPDTDDIPEPNSAIRIMRVMQLTSGFVSHANPDGGPSVTTYLKEQKKANWLASELKKGEMQSLEAIIIWCRWRAEREYLATFLKKETEYEIYQVFGGQTQVSRDNNIAAFQTTRVGHKRLMLGQPHAGGFGLTFTAAHFCLYMSNDFSYKARVQSEARIDRIGQEFPMTIMDVLARGPQGQESMDHHAVKILANKGNLAELTCRAWRKILSGEPSGPMVENNED